MWVILLLRPIIVFRRSCQCCRPPSWLEMLSTPKTTIQRWYPRKTMNKKNRLCKDNALFRRHLKQISFNLETSSHNIFVSEWTEPKRKKASFLFKIKISVSKEYTNIKKKFFRVYLSVFAFHIFKLAIRHH